MNIHLKKLLARFSLLSITLLYSSSCQDRTVSDSKGMTPVDLVNPYMGNISHMLVPTFPTVHLPNSLMRVYPERRDFTGDRLHGLPMMVTSHRGSSAFNLSFYQGNEEGITSVIDYSYDQEKLTPYSYNVFLDEAEIEVEFGLSHQSARYEITFTQNKPTHLILNSRNGKLKWDGQAVKGYQQIANGVKVYVYMKPDIPPLQVSGLNREDSLVSMDSESGARALVLHYDHSSLLAINYGISFIDERQAQRNQERELYGKNVEMLQQKGREIWNDALGKISVRGGTDKDQRVFYSSLYRCYERPVCISEDGRYFSAFDGQVHEDEGRPFYTDDWIWDSYRAHHPLRVLIDADKESDILHSFVTMAEQMDDFWLPTFPEITGDSRRMNSNHGVATIVDAYRKGVRGFNLESAYAASKGAITEKTLAPWSGSPAGQLDLFYKMKGYIPALYPDEEETIPEVSGFEKRQPVAVTLGTAYDEWCLAQMASDLAYDADYKHFLARSHNYRNLFNEETGFFHPKDQYGKFISPFDYRFSGGLGARNYYGENNGWTYRWDVQHNIADLIQLMGGSEQFVQNLDRTFQEPMGRGKSQFYGQLPDQTGNVGQFSMANEPSLHIPYLYTYAGQPWKTQKRIRSLVDTWFRNDLMGVPGDEDGGGMSAFVVFSQMGFYPVTPGMPMYVIGTPFFEHVKIDLGEGTILSIEAKNASKRNKYIQSAELNGKPLEKAWVTHEELLKGGKLVFEMGEKANKQWGSDPLLSPPSFDYW
ncbi:GH92 family glycosyl hydrolase [Echinicola sp. 20G]|uniref:GH92 family glycosyl hydrolase n=1 Tax=Echinicola sp. 20G TaxID=2781961 RepID=UPI0019108340|nr:GH92 family glycosyl hydrolase [Echinicola sp. 20G]